jgi:murein DD-endopeptidase MepM/ murein hydrolase activator NlpD
MAERKYRYNTRTLSYEKIKPTLKDRLIRAFNYTLSSAVGAVAFILFSYFFMESPKEKRLRQENEELKLQFSLLDQRMNSMASVLEELEHRDDNLYRVVFEADPIPAAIRKAGMGGVNRYKSYENLNNSDLIIASHKKLDRLTKQLYIQTKSFDEVIDMAEKKEELLRSIPSIMPVAFTDLDHVSSGYGMRLHPILKIERMHWGQDFTAPVGTDVYATGDGEVELLEKQNHGYGYHVIINHGHGYKTIYAHLSEFKVRKGQKIKRGEAVGTIGNTGLSTAPHLHYEVEKNGQKINPVNFYYQDLSPEQFSSILKRSEEPLQSFD